MSDFSNRLDTLLINNHLRRIDLVRGTGINEGTIRGWIRGQTPSVEAAYKVAQYFGVTVEYLVTGNTDGLPDEERIFLNEEEKEILNVFRNLSARDKQTVLSLAHTLER